MKAPLFLEPPLGSVAPPPSLPPHSVGLPQQQSRRLPLAPGAPRYHPSSIVTHELDLDAGTLSFLVDGEPQPVVISVPKDKPLYPG
jgi:hypothetical protein